MLLTQEDEMASPYLIISNFMINKCYLLSWNIRTVFELSEINIFNAQISEVNQALVISHFYIYIYINTIYFICA